MKAINFSLVLVLAAFPLTSVTAQTIYNNGSFITSTGTGVGGADESMLQDYSYGMSVYGFSHTPSEGTRVADDFTVYSFEEWEIESITFFSHDRSAPIVIGAKATSGLSLRIWDGPPGDTGSSIIFVNPDCLTSTTYTGVYRVDEFSAGYDDTRPIFANVCTVNITLTAGTYWLDWQTPSDDPQAVPEAPPVTTLGQTGSGNALWFIDNTWVPAIDVTQQDFPFIIQGQDYWIEPSLPIPSDFHVRDQEFADTLFSCVDEVKPPLPSDMTSNLSWMEALDGTPPNQFPADGYRIQVFEGPDCEDLIIEDEDWLDGLNWPGAYEDPFYGYGFLPPGPGDYSWRVRSAFDVEGIAYSLWSACCNIQVLDECQTLAAPRVTEIGETTCGGDTDETLPWIRWTDEKNDDGYEWQLLDIGGNILMGGMTGPNVPIAQIGPLTPNYYVLRVRTLGDGQIYCDSEWSDDCPFSVGGGPDTSVDFTWWPDQPKQGEAIRFADLTTGAPLSWLWDFGDGSTSDQQHPMHVFGGPGEYIVVRDVELETGHVIEEKTITVAGVVECGNNVCESGETAWSCPADCALPPGATGRAGGSDRRPTVPAAAGGLHGKLGALWTTEAWIYNPGPDPAEIVMEFTARGQTEILQAGPFSLDPEQSLYWDNVVEDLFNTTGSGALWVDSTVPVLFLTRTYTVNTGTKAVTEPGSFGQAFLGTRESLTLAQGDGELYLIGLREDDRFRSNLYFQEVDNKEITVDLKVFDNTGALLGGEVFTIDGHSQRQKSLGQHLGISGVSAAFATVEVTAGDGRLGAAGSVIDNVTGDPTSIDAIHPNQVAGNQGAKRTGAAADEDVHTLVAAVANTTGLFASVWKSSLTIHNQDSTSQAVHLMYDVEQDRSGQLADTLEADVTIPAKQQKTWDNVLVELFNIPENAPTQGALHLYSDNGLMVSSRTYNERSNGGTYGLGLPGLTAGDMIDGSGKFGKMVGLRHASKTRTNIGLAEYSGQETVVELSFSTTLLEGFHLGTLTRTVPANSHVQLLKVFEALPDLEGIDLDGLKVEVTVKSGGSIYAYATMIDNQSGDPTAFTTSQD